MSPHQGGPSQSKTDIHVIAIPYFISLENLGPCPPPKNSDAIETQNPYYFVYGAGAGQSTSELNSVLPLDSLPAQGGENENDRMAGIDNPFASSLEQNNIIASSDDQFNCSRLMMNL